MTHQTDHPLTWIEIEDIFHEEILTALDQAARRTFNPPRNDAGANDADLPRLFRAIDEQVRVLAARYNAAIDKF